MKRIRPKLWNRVEMISGEIACETPGSSDKSRRWVAIYPAPVHQVSQRVPSHRYSVLVFELDKLLMREYEGDEDLIMFNKERYYANSESELYSLLDKLNVNPESFDVPWRCDYPL